WINLSATAIVRVLQTDKACAYQVIVLGPDLVLELRHVENAAVAGKSTTGHAAVNRRPARLGIVDVATRAAEQLVARLGMDANGDGVRHGSRRHEQGGLLAQQSGHALLQPVDRRVLAEDVVADLGGGHRCSHAGRWPGHGIAAQVEKTIWHVENDPLNKKS